MKIDDTLPFGFEDTSFQSAGGQKGIAKLVHEFYANMETFSEASEIRRMHPVDLKESEDKLTRFLCGWMGGPKLYREKYGTINIPQAHQHLTVTEESRDAWLLCMDKAIDRQPYSEKFSAYLKTQLRVPAERIFQTAKKN